MSIFTLWSVWIRERWRQHKPEHSILKVMKNLFFFLLIALFAPLFTSCTIRIPSGGHGQRGHSGDHYSHHRQQRPHGEWTRSRFEVGRNHVHGSVSVEVGSRSMSREEKIALQEKLCAKGKEFSEHTGQTPTREQFLNWGQAMESRDFDVRLSGAKRESTFEAHEEPKLIHKERVPESQVPADIRKEAYQNLQHGSVGGPQFLPPTFGGIQAPCRTFR